MPSWPCSPLGLGVVVVIGLSVTGCSASSTPSGDASVVPSKAVSSTSVPSSASASASTSTQPAVANPDPVDSALRDKLTAMCGDMVAFNLAHQWEDVYSYLQPTADQLPGVAAHLDAEPVNHELMDRVSSFGKPTKGLTSWSRLVADLSTYAATTTDQIAAAKAGNLAHFLETVPAIREIDAQIRDDLRVAGFRPGDSCMFLFEPPKGHYGM